MHRKTDLTPPHPPVIITDCPKAVLSWCFMCFMFAVVQLLNALILTLLYVLFFSNLVKITTLLPVWEGAANSAYHLLFRSMLRYVCPSFPLMFRTSFGF